MNNTESECVMRKFFPPLTAMSCFIFLISKTAQFFCSDNAYPFVHFSENHLVFFFKTKKLYLGYIADTEKTVRFFLKKEKVIVTSI